MDNHWCETNPEKRTMKPRGLDFEERLKVEGEITYIFYSTALKSASGRYSWHDSGLYVLFLPPECSQIKNLFSYWADRWRAACVCWSVNYRKLVLAKRAQCIKDYKVKCHTTYKLIWMQCRQVRIAELSYSMNITTMSYHGKR